MEVQKNHQLRQGTLLDGRYEIGAVLGEGGFGITYSGSNINTGEKVAIKEFFSRDYMGRSGDGTGKTVLTEDSAEKRFLSERKRFLREARIVRDFRDEENIVAVSDYFEENDTAYIVMEFLEGVTLEQYVRENGRWEAMDFFEHLRPLLQALSKLHAAGLVHRDISPQNIIYTTDGRFVLIDFGSAKNLKSSTVTTTTTYKEGYAPPEQYQSRNTPSACVDIYGICATMYYCLTAEAPVSSIQRILFDDMLPVSSVSPSVPAQISEMITKGMSLMPEDRQESVDDILPVIDDIYLTPEERAQIRRRRLLRRAAVIAAIVIAAAAGIFHFVDNYSYYRMKLQDTSCTHLEWDDEATAEEMSSLLRGRLDAFAGEGNYSLETHDKEVQLELPLDVFHDLDPDDAADYYLTHAYASFAICSANAVGERDGTYDLDGNLFIANNSLKFRAQDIESLDVSTDPIPIAPDSTAEVRHITMVLDESTAGRSSGLLSEAGKMLFFDVDGDIGTRAYSAGDGRTIYILDRNGLDQEKYEEMINCTLSARKGESLAVPDTAGGDFCALIAANISGGREDAFVEPSSIHTELVVDWDRKASGSKSGEYQCAPEEIKGESMLLSFDISAGDLSSGDRSKSITGFKARLDALEVPYAFGTNHFDSNNIVIRISSGSITESELRLLSSHDNFDITNGYTSYTLSDSRGFLIESNEQYDLAIRLDDYQLERVMPVIEQNERTGLGHIYLKYDNVPVAYADTQDAREAAGNSRIVFDKPCTGIVTEDQERLKRHLRLVQALGENELSTDMVLKSVELSDKEGDYAGLGDYSSFSGGSYTGIYSIVDALSKELEPSGIRTVLRPSDNSGSIRIIADNLETSGFEKNAAVLISNIINGHTLYSNDAHTGSVAFVLSNKRSRGPSEPLLRTTVLLLPDLRTDASEQESGSASDRLITEGVPFRIYSSVSSIMVSAYDADDMDDPDPEETAAATERLIQALADTGLHYYYEKSE